MKIINMYQCEICKEVYHNESEAEMCESKCREQELVKQGDLIEYLVEMGGGFDSYWVDARIGDVVRRNEHYNVYKIEFYANDIDEWYENAEVWGNEEFLKYIKIK